MYPNHALFWPRGYKTFLCSNQLSTEFQLLINTKIPTNEKVSALSISDLVLILLINVKMSALVGKQDKFRAQLSWAWKKFYKLGACYGFNNSSSIQRSIRIAFMCIVCFKTQHQCACKNDQINQNLRKQNSVMQWTIYVGVKCLNHQKG